MTDLVSILALVGFGFMMPALVVFADGEAHLRCSSFLFFFVIGLSGIGLTWLRLTVAGRKLDEVIGISRMDGTETDVENWLLHLIC